ncbi:hypothetical protein A6E12_09230 [Aliivibrio fischeri]|uniref:sulfotransferase family protein n=1 Tax=Aliivibrio fischeri TaxID=668 RepID=UPI00080EA568|nr:sulfotransferase [Aliivibrio fischeri]OCH28662.1 hypothetical protein A6E12_09230 [Aliivibrio fischeri]
MPLLFITGMMRSGTTLLQKALNVHPEINVTYQSRTEEYIKLLKTFYSSIGVNKYHVLSHYSPNKDCSFSDVQKWLLNNAEYEKLFDTQDSYYSGVKEVLSEEFIPYFISNKIKCINIVRDPRDVICSMSFGKGIQYTGSERPVLFDIKNWRKSVLISEIFKESDYLLTIKMEDLLRNPEYIMTQIYRFLNVETITHDDLISEMSKLNWTANSSFGQRKLFDESVINNYKNNLPSEVINYIEATCLNEMNHMGYDAQQDLDVESIIRTYEDPFQVTRNEFLPLYSSNNKNIQYEIERHSLKIKDIIKLEFGV